MSPHLKKSINQAHLKNCTYEQIVTHLERELELNGLEAPNELPINNVSQQPTNTNADRPKPTCHHFKNQDITEISVACWKNSENKLKIIKIIPETKTVPPIPLTRTKMSTTITTTKTVKKRKESQKLSTHPVKHVGKQTTSQKNATMEPMQPIDRLPGIEDWKDKIRYQREPIKVILRKLLKLQPQFKISMPRLHSNAAIDRPDTTHLKLPPIPEVVWQQPQETHVPNNYQNLTNETYKNTHTPESKQRTAVESQTLPIKDTSTQVPVSSTEPLLGNQTRSALVPSLNNSKKPNSEIQRKKIDMTTYDNGDYNISPPVITFSQIEERLVRDKITNELYMTLSSTIVLKRKKNVVCPSEFPE